MEKDLFSDIKKIREITGASFILCKEAILNTSSFDLALDYIRKKNNTYINKINSKKTLSGIVDFKIFDNYCLIIKINCETDFVAKSENFLNLIQDLFNIIIFYLKRDNIRITYNYNDLINNKDLYFEIKKKIDISIALFKENICLSDFFCYYGISGGYTHSNKLMSSIILLDVNKEYLEIKNIIDELIKNLCMQIVALNPLYIDINNVDARVIEKEKEFLREQILKEKSKIFFIDKIIEGRMIKYFQNICLLEQNYIKDENLKIKELVQNVEKKNNLNIKIISFVRFFI